MEEGFLVRNTSFLNFFNMGLKGSLTCNQIFFFLEAIIKSCLSD